MRNTVTMPVLLLHALDEGRRVLSGVGHVQGLQLAIGAEQRVGPDLDRIRLLGRVGSGGRQGPRA
jgi:hypothetical protein